jgi:hypothetical protein
MSNDRGSSSRAAGSAVQPCRHRIISARWLTRSAYCGDEARFKVVVTGHPPECDARIQIQRISAAGAVSRINSINLPLINGRIEDTWWAKAPSADWRNDRIKFTVSIPSLGLTRESRNTFSFRQRPASDSWNRIDRDHPCNNNFAPVIELHDARLEASRVHYSLKIKLTGAAMAPDRQRNAKLSIQNIWNHMGRRKFHRTGCQRGPECDCRYDCCKVGFRLDFNFVPSDEHLSIEIRRPPDPTNPPASCLGRRGGYWYEPPLDEETVYAHEIGHMLGQFDEYASGGTDPSGVQPAHPIPPPSPTPNLMDTGGETELFNRHYRRVLEYLNTKTSGDEYEIIPHSS